MLDDDTARNDILNRLRRAEGQLRGIQRMIEEGESCQAVAGQMSAVRRALDSASARMTACWVGQQLQQRLSVPRGQRAVVAEVLEDMQSMLGKLR